MSPGPLWLVVICLLRAGPADAGVTQTTRHLVTGRGQNVTLRCKPITGHPYVYWYQQQAGRGLHFLIYFQNSKTMDESGLPNDRFSATNQDSSSKLSVQNAEPGDSARYFCASSVSTALGPRPCSIHKPPACTKRVGRWESTRGGLGGRGMKTSAIPTESWTAPPAPPPPCPGHPLPHPTSICS
uniref:Ig-like domain-containing protein n=1 Tax=Ornithorhynchus anatinus TaxID=9258 RepID=A0A6I8N955_ORNAN